MANENVKTLQTRIALKYDEYAHWLDDNTPGKGANLVLLKGEIGLCAVPDEIQDGRPSPATNNPTVLFKVGDGVTPFSELKWASAMAADVYSWAKASDVVLDGKTIKFVGSNKTVTLDYVTEDEVTAITDPLSQKIASIEANLGSNGSVGQAIEDLDGRLSALEGVDGTIVTTAAATLASANAYTDSAKTAAVNAASAYTDTEVAKDRVRLTSIEEAADELSTQVAGNTSAISAETTARIEADAALDAAYRAADAAIEAKIGGSYTDKATVHAAVEAAANAAANAAQAVADLANGAVTANTEAIEVNATAIAGLSSSLSTEASTRADADEALNERLERVEAFFGAAYDEQGEPLTKALDTLIEIQDYITSDGTAAVEMIEDIQANTNAIEALQSAVNEGGSLEARVAANEVAIAGINSDLSVANGNIDDIQVIVSTGDNANIKLRNAITALQNLTGADSDCGNVGLRADVDSMAEDFAEAVETLAETTETANAAKEAAEENAQVIAGIQSDMGNCVRFDSWFTIDCGTATTVIDANG